MQFRSWLEETITWCGYDMPRWAAIRRFVVEGLVPFVKQRGYEFAFSDKELQNLFATGLFTNRKRSCMESVWPGPAAPSGATDEEAAHFHHCIDPAAWEQFWNAWGQWTDVDPNDSSRAEDRRIDIQAAVWKYLDLDRSGQTITLSEIMAGGEEDDAFPSRPGQQGVDSYLQDAEHNGWGGYRR